MSDNCPTTGKEDCGYCSGECCMRHGYKPCNCDVADRHTSECIIPACGDHPDLLGYMVGQDDGVSTLYRTPKEAVEKFKAAKSGE